MGKELTPVQLERELERVRRWRRPGFLIQLALLALLALGPLLMPSFRMMDMVTKIIIFAVAVASFDIILGYTGIISFAHGMFFGLGAYAVALTCHQAGTPQYHHLLLAGLAAVAVSAAIALVVAVFSLRVKAIFFAMMTLAVAEFAHILGYQWSSLTMGEDGVSFKLPGILNTQWTGGHFLGAQVNGRLLTYYLILAAAALLFVGLVRFVRSPAGRVLKAVRDNEKRAVALGYRIFHYRVLATVFGSVVAALCGSLFALWLGYVNPDTVLGTGLMLNILLMIIIGGLGTVYGGIVGAAFITVAETWLPDGLGALVALLPKAEMLQRLAERWVLFFGLAYVLVVLFFPKGVVGTIRQRISGHRLGRPRKLGE